MCAAKQTQEVPTNEEELPPPVTSLLDRDIIELFTPSESGSQENLKQESPTADGEQEVNGTVTQCASSSVCLSQDAASQFPSLMNTLETTNNDDQDSILASMTPILTRPSIAASISRSSSLHESETAPQSLDDETGEVQKQQRQSGLFISHTAEDNQQTTEKAPVNDEEEETSFSADTMDDPPPPIPSTAAPPPPPVEDDELENEELTDVQLPAQLTAESEEQPLAMQSSDKLPVAPPSSPIEMGITESSPTVTSDTVLSDDAPTTAVSPDNLPSLPADAPPSPPSEMNTPPIPHEIPPSLPEELPPTVVEQSSPEPTLSLSADQAEIDLQEEPPQLPEDNSPDLQEPPQLPEDNPPDLQEPPQLPEDNPPDLQEEPPQLPESNPPVVQVEASSDEPLAVSTESPPIVADSPPPLPDLAGSPEPTLQPAESPKESGKKTPPSPKRLIPTPPPPYKAFQSASAAASQPKPHAPSPAPVSKERGQEGEIYEVEVKKGLLGLGIKVTTNESGLVVVKSLSSSSPLTKDGTMRSVTSL